MAEIRTIDARGLSCPQPVLYTKRAMDEGETDIVVLADDTVARDNIRRLAENSGYAVQVEESNDTITIRIKKT